jgi:predicted Rdx family selenoprotein
VKAWFDAHDRGPVEIETGKSGQFDVVIDGRLAYSRYDTGRFPAEADLAIIARANPG